MMRDDDGHDHRFACVNGAKNIVELDAERVSFIIVNAGRGQVMAAI